MIKSDDGYISYIVNPKAGSSGSKMNSRLFEIYLNKKGYDVRLRPTHSLADTCEAATDAAVDYNCAMVVVAGGDGTVREAAHGLEGSDKPLLIVPCGTENLLASQIGIDKKLSTVIKVFKNGIVTDFDLGSINGKCFTSIVGVGFDGTVVHKVSTEREGYITHLDYFWPLWDTFWNHSFEHFTVSADDKNIFEGRGMVFVGNISRYAVGLDILKNADYSDELLDVCIFKCCSRLKLLKHSVKTILKLHIKGKDVIYTQAKNIKIDSSSKNVKTEIDGDPGPDLPLEIKIIPRAVKLLIAKDAKPVGMRARILGALK
jgi:YegS/Rv2252/BmrU family lipid kinase